MGESWPGRQTTKVRVFHLVHALENDVARACLMNSVRTRDAQ